MFQNLVIVFALTFLVESMIEYLFGTLFGKVPKLEPYKWTLMYLALAAGVGLAFYYQVDLIAMLPPGTAITPVGIILSGLAIGRGSNFLHQFVSQFFPTKESRMSTELAVESAGSSDKVEAGNVVRYYLIKLPISISFTQPSIIEVKAKPMPPYHPNFRWLFMTVPPKGTAIPPTVEELG